MAIPGSNNTNTANCTRLWYFHNHKFVCFGYEIYPKSPKGGCTYEIKTIGTQGIESAAGELITNYICLGKCNTRRSKVWTNGEIVEDICTKENSEKPYRKNSVVQAITLQPWLEQADLGRVRRGRLWIVLGVKSNAFVGSPPHNSTWGDRNYSCTLCIMCGTIAFHLELAPRRLLRRITGIQRRLQRKPGWTSHEQPPTVQLTILMVAKVGKRSQKVSAAAKPFLSAPLQLHCLRGKQCLLQMFRCPRKLSQRFAFPKSAQ